MKKYLDEEAALRRMQKYCAYQERCHQEVRSKLISLEVYGDRLERIIAELVTENYLNEERFARMYARGKFNIKGWGRRKIINELKRRKISNYCIKKAMTEIVEDDYLVKLKSIVSKKFDDYNKGTRYVRGQKVYRYCYDRGYESPLISYAINAYWQEKDAQSG